MSELPSTERRRRLRAEARRSIAAILDAAVRILAERPEATMDEIASAAGVSRQTVYAHYPSRDVLLRAAFDQVVAEAVAAIDAVRLDEGPAADALVRLLEVSWRTFDRYPLLLTASVPRTPEEDRELHRDVLDRLDRLVRRGQDAGEFTRDLSPTWLIAAVIALGHAAGEEVKAGRMTADEAVAATRASVLRVVAP